jgi:hypothetical protein
MRASISQMEPCADLNSNGFGNDTEICWQQLSDSTKENGRHVNSAGGGVGRDVIVQTELAYIFVKLMPIFTSPKVKNLYLILQSHFELKLCFSDIELVERVVPGRIHFVRPAVKTTSASAAQAAFEFSTRVYFGSSYYAGSTQVAYTKLIDNIIGFPDTCITLQDVAKHKPGNAGAHLVVPSNVSPKTLVNNVEIDIALVAKAGSEKYRLLMGIQLQEDVECRVDTSAAESPEKDDARVDVHENLQTYDPANLPTILLYYCRFEMAIFVTLLNMSVDSVEAGRRYFSAGCVSVHGTSIDSKVCSEGEDFANMFSVNRSQSHPAAEGFHVISGPFSGRHVMSVEFVPTQSNSPPAKYFLSLHHAWTRYHLQLALWGAAARGISEHMRAIAIILESYGGCKGDGDDSNDGTVEHSASFIPYISELSTPLLIAVQRGHIEAVNELLTWHSIFPKTNMCSPLTFRNRDGHSALVSAVSFGNHTGHFQKRRRRDEMVSAILPVMESLWTISNGPKMSEVICQAMDAAGSSGDWKALRVLMRSKFSYYSNPKLHRNGVAMALLKCAKGGHEDCVVNILAADSQQSNKQDRLFNVLAPTVCDSFSRYSATVPLQEHPAEMTPLIAATRLGNPHIVQMLLIHLPQSLSLRDVFDMSALAWAVFLVPDAESSEETEKHDRRHVVRLLLDAGADPVERVQFHNVLLDIVRDDMTRSILFNSRLMRFQRNIQSEGRKFAICFKGQKRDVFDRLWSTNRNKLISPLEMGGRNTVDLFGVQAGDVYGNPDLGFHEHMFAPLKATGLYFHSKQNQDNRTFLSKYDTLQMRSCFQFGLQGGSYGALEGLLLVVQDVGRCMDVIEAAEKEQNWQYTHIAMTRFDIVPRRKILLPQLKDIDTHVYVPSMSSLGVDDSLALGPRRHMEKYLRGMLGEFSSVLSDGVRCEYALACEHFVQNNMVSFGLPTRHSPLLNVDRFKLDPATNQLVIRGKTAKKMKKED